MLSEKKKKKNIVIKIEKILYLYKKIKTRNKLKKRGKPQKIINTF